MARAHLLLHRAVGDAPSGLELLAGDLQHALYEIRVGAEAYTDERLDLRSQSRDEAALLRQDKQPQHTRDPQAQGFRDTTTGALIDDQPIGVNLEGEADGFALTRAESRP